MDLSDTLTKKLPRKFGDGWKDRDFAYDAATKVLSYFYQEKLKGKGTVIGLTDVVDRKGKRAFRFDMQLKRHKDHPGSEWICVCAHDFATKDKWLTGLEVKRKATMLDEDGNALAADAAIAAATAAAAPEAAPAAEDTEDSKDTEGAPEDDGAGEDAAAGVAAEDAPVVSFERLVQDSTFACRPATIAEAKALKDAALDGGPPVVIVDVRGADEVAAPANLSDFPGVALKVDGAVNLPRGLLEFKATAGFPGGQAPALADRSAHVLTYCSTGDRAALAAASLRQMGFANARSMGALADWQEAGGDVNSDVNAPPLPAPTAPSEPPPEGAPTCGSLVAAAQEKTGGKLDFAAAQAKYGQVLTVVLDVREAGELAAGTIEGAVTIPRGMLEFQFPQFVEGQTALAAVGRGDIAVLAYCGSGGRAALAADTLQRMGFTGARAIGSLKDWQAAGGATTAGTLAAPAAPPPQEGTDVDAGSADAAVKPASCCAVM